MNIDAPIISYSTSDFCLAATLLSLGFQVLSMQRVDAKRVSFCFGDSVEVIRAVDSYWENKITVLPQTFYFAQRELKARVQAVMTQQSESHPFR